jgi:hypothetical protein
MTSIKILISALLCRFNLELIGDEAAIDYQFDKD